MFALTHILVPTNLGEPSQTAIKYGVAFARQFGAKLSLVHVLPSRELDAVIETERVMEALAPTVLRVGSAEPSSFEVARNAAQHDLGQLLSLEEERDTRADYLLRASGIAGPGDAIVACATELEVELIIMGKYRLGFVAQLLAGSVTEKVIRHAPCPVLIVQHPEHDFVVESAGTEAEAS